MKKVFIVMCILLCVPFFFWNCDNEEDMDYLSVLFRIHHYNSGRRAPDWNVIHVPSIWANAEIQGNRIPHVNHVDIAGKPFSDSENFYLEFGYVYFSSYTRIWEDSIPEPKFNPVNVTIQTDLGELKGSITVPDTLSSLSVNAPDSIDYSTPVTISWSGSNADFYHVSFFHDWMYYIGDGIVWLGYSIDTVVTGSSATFNRSEFAMDGIISDFSVIPVNGPFPEYGSESNMTGDGSGYIYMENDRIDLDRIIIIGEGIDYTMFFKASDKRSGPEIPSDMLYKKIKKHLDL